MLHESIPRCLDHSCPLREQCARFIERTTGYHAEPSLRPDGERNCFNHINPKGEWIGPPMRFISGPVGSFYQGGEWRGKRRNSGFTHMPEEEGNKRFRLKTEKEETKGEN
jgi:hypothetical protein